MPTPPRQVLVVGILIAVGLALVATEVVQQAWSRQATLLEPWQRALAASALPPGGGKPVDALDELANAKAENANLRARLAEYESIEGEGGVDPHAALLKRSRILARSTRQGRRHSEIDLGAVDGVQQGMAAIIGWSLVGVVIGVRDGSALVREVTDGESRIPAVLMAGDDVVGEGVAVGTGKRGQLALDFIEDRQGLRVEPGMRVVTAALPPCIPRGLVLGIVTDAARSPTTDHWRIDVAPLRLMASADTVALLRPAVSPP